MNFFAIAPRLRHVLCRRQRKVADNLHVQPGRCGGCREMFIRPRRTSTGITSRISRIRTPRPLDLVDPGTSCSVCRACATKTACSTATAGCRRLLKRKSHWPGAITYCIPVSTPTLWSSAAHARPGSDRGFSHERQGGALRTLRRRFGADAARPGRALPGGQGLSWAAKRTRRPQGIVRLSRR